MLVTENMNINNRQARKVLPIAFFLSFLLTGLLIYKDYGIPADEVWQRNIGLKSLEYLSHVFNIKSLLNGVQPLSNPALIYEGFTDRDYGVIFELPVEWLIKVFSIDGQDIYYFRHLATFLTFYVACIFFYKTISLRYSNYRLSLLGVAMLILSPRIFGDSFYNDKDLVFLSFFVIATYTFTRYIVSPTIRNIIYHALACAIAINCRLMGLVLPAATLAVILFLCLTGKISWKKSLYQAVIYLITLLIFTVVFWPWLWISPYEHLLAALKNMAHFRTAPNMHFMGEIISAKNLPWFYIPVWIAITTPVMYLGFCCLGLMKIVKNIFKNNFFTRNRQEDLLDAVYLGLFISPIVMVAVLHSVLYNGWRHLYFIYPTLILVCLCGVQYLFNLFSGRRMVQLVLSCGLVIAMVVTACWMVLSHPYQYLYFNSLAGNWAKKYDLDYWGVAYLRPLKYILAQDPENVYAVFNNGEYDADGRQIFDYPDQTHWLIPYSWNNLLLKEGAFIINRSEACSDYVFLPERGKKIQEYLKRPEFEKFDEVIVGGHIIYAVFKRRIPLEGGIYSPKTGDSINFSNPDSRCFLFQGWNEGHESWGVWSDNYNAKLWLRPAVGSKRVEIDFRAMVNSSHPEQRLVVHTVGGKDKVFKFNNFDSNKVVLDLPFYNSKDEFIKIDFDIPDAVSPLDLDLSEDGRKLGIGIKSIKYLP